MIKFYKIRIPLLIFSLIIILTGMWFYFGKNIIKDKDLGIFTPKGFNFGVDFQGGLIHQATVYSGITINEVRDFTNQSELGFDVQQVIIDKSKQIGNSASFLIKTILTDEDQKIIDEDPELTPAKYLNDRITKFHKLITDKYGLTYEIKGDELILANKLYPDQMTGEILEKRTDTLRVVDNVVKESENVISPVYSRSLQLQAIFLTLFVLGIMLLYITIRFRINYALGAILALFHDVLIMLGFIAFMQLEFDYTLIAAILFIIGYSVNDTIVVFDRIRENFNIMKDFSERDIVNVSINQTLTRTIITSFTTFLAILALFLWGGDKIYGFSLSIIVGLFAGTYSSIIIASPVVEVWDIVFNKKRRKQVKELKKVEFEQKIEEKNIEQAVKEDNTSNTQPSVNSQKIALSKKQLKKLISGKKKK